MKDYTLREYAERHALTYRTLWNKFKEGKLPNAYKDEFGHIKVKNKLDNIGDRTIVYARVSSNDRKELLKEQQAKLENYVVLNNLTLVDSYKEIASGMNDNRTVLNKIFKRTDWDILLVENKDRLTRFGFNYIKILLEQQGKKIIVINDTDDNKEDLMKDLISVIYSFSARMYGLRRKKTKQEIIDFIEN
jgi:predicted site-specific integrase-resolvase